MKNKFGFTLAEVLITLVVLGVIAAITIPNIMHKIQDRMTIAKVKQAYSSLSSAWDIYQVNHYCKGGACIFDQSNNLCNSDIEKIFLENLNVKEHEIYINNNFRLANYFPTNIKNIDGSSARTSVAAWGSCHFILKNNTVVRIARNADWTSAKGTFYDSFNLIFDINGKKLPNQYGKDIFVIGFYPDGDIAPAPVDTVALGGDYAFSGMCYYLKGNKTIRCVDGYMPERVPLAYILQYNKLPDISKLQK